MTLSPTFCALPQAPITKVSLTATQAIVSMPLALRSAARSTKPGRWRCEQARSQGVRGAPEPDQKAREFGIRAGGRHSR